MAGEYHAHDQHPTTTPQRLTIIAAAARSSTPTCRSTRRSCCSVTLPASATPLVAESSLARTSPPSSAALNRVQLLRHYLQPSHISRTLTPSPPSPASSPPHQPPQIRHKRQRLLPIFSLDPSPQGSSISRSSVSSASLIANPQLRRAGASTSRSAAVRFAPLVCPEPQHRPHKSRIRRRPSPQQFVPARYVRAPAKAPHRHSRHHRAQHRRPHPQSRQSASPADAAGSSAQTSASERSCTTHSPPHTSPASAPTSP